MKYIHYNTIRIDYDIYYYIYYENLIMNYYYIFSYIHIMYLVPMLSAYINHNYLFIIYLVYFQTYIYISNKPVIHLPIVYMNNWTKMNQYTLRYVFTAACWMNMHKPSSRGAIHPSKPINWHPLHTPKLNLVASLRKLLNCSRTLTLNFKVAAHPGFRKKRWCHINHMKKYIYNKYQHCIIYFVL